MYTNASRLIHLFLIPENESSWWMKEQLARMLQFPINAAPRLDVESAELRMLVPPQKDGPTTVRVQVNLVISPRQKRLISERTFYLSTNQTKWCSTDVTSAVRSWMSGNRNLGLELVCLDVNCNLNISNVAITTLIYSDSNRVRRSSPYQSVRRTDCQKGKRKRKCCRQNMKVNFSKLNFPELNFIIEPKQYEAGYCHGLCPPNYNHATNHSRIQSLMHQMDKSNPSKSSKKRIVPKTCCVPSKLESLDILLINKDDPTKLVVEKWDNMVVNECACS